MTKNDFAKVMRGDVLCHTERLRQIGLVLRVSREGEIAIVEVLWEAGDRYTYTPCDAKNLEHGA
jgi:hypothetical protein